MFDWLFRRSPSTPTRPFLRFGLTLLEVRPAGIVEARAMPFEPGIRSRARSLGGSGDRTWEHIRGWTGLSVLHSVSVDVGRSETRTVELPEGHRIRGRFEEVTSGSLLKLSVDHATKGVARSSAGCRDKPGTEYYRVIDITLPTRAVVLVQRSDLEA